MTGVSVTGPGMYSDVLCHSRCGTLKISYCSVAMRAEYRSNFVALYGNGNVVLYGFIQYLIQSCSGLVIYSLDKVFKLGTLMKVFSYFLIAYSMYIILTLILRIIL